MQIVDVPHVPVQEFGSSGVWMFFGLSPQSSSDVRVHAAYFERGGTIGAHPTRLWQVFWVLWGRGRVVGADGQERPIGPGQAVVWEPGEAHQSWADEPMAAVILQSRDQPRPEL